MSSSIALVCSFCSQTFEKKSACDSHKQYCSMRTTYTLTLPHNLGKVEVKRHTINGKLYWQCNCTSSMCEKHYETIQALRKHVKKENQPWTTEVSLLIIYIMYLIFIKLYIFKKSTTAVAENIDNFRYNQSVSSHIFNNIFQLIIIRLYQLHLLL